MPSPPHLYAFGSNGSGQLGIGHTEDVSIPTRCLAYNDDDEEDGGENLFSRSNYAVSIDRIVAGGNHTLLLLSDRRVYAAGEGGDGRCGDGSLRDKDINGDGESENLVKRFRRVRIRDPEAGSRSGSGRSVYDTFEAVSATWEATILVTSGVRDETERVGDGVFVVGSGAKGELGLGVGVLRADRAMKIPDFPPMGTGVVSVSSGMGHTVVVLSNGEVYGWGGARKGQLGAAAVGDKIVWSPVKIEGVPFPVSEVTCGREFTVLSGDKSAGEFAVLGSTGNKWNILSDVPSSEDVKGYLQINASWHGVYILRQDMSVIGWGRDDRGQLPPKALGRVRDVAVGSEHAVALLQGRSVVAFGWGEHGNCGPETDTQGNVKGAATQIPVPVGVEVVGVGAGCATSWVIASRAAS
ncbi:regulator of chromosome condensation 1/beta-lactamase-inhibitor protein II [Aspergillus californicus]